MKKYSLNKNDDFHASDSVMPLVDSLRFSSDTLAALIDFKRKQTEIFKLFAI